MLGLFLLWAPCVGEGSPGGDAAADDKTSKVLGFRVEGLGHSEMMTVVQRQKADGT